MVGSALSFRAPPHVKTSNVLSGGGGGSGARGTRGSRRSACCMFIASFVRFRSAPGGRLQVRC